MIIGTAGHIDHGKSALVTALTGRPVDRLAEERRRGITIDLTFAPLEFPDAPPAGIVDVPGHEDFVRTMVAGASGIDLVLLVIDLGEGPRPQTEEHLTIVEQLRIPRGIPVFTKLDLVDADWADLVVSDFLPRLARSPVTWETPALVSSLTGAGIAALRQRLREAVTAERVESDREPFRMPIDRAFSAAGVGTVVTGTTWNGRVGIGDQVRILPGDRSARVRSIEAYGLPRQRTMAGVRTALGLAGVDRAELTRGDVVVTGDWRDTAMLDVAIELLSTAPKPLVRRSRVRVHLGTTEVMARCLPVGPIEPGRSGPARLLLEGEVVARGTDRFVLRSYSPVHTIGGGEVLDPTPPRGGRWTPGLLAVDPAERLVALADRRPFGVPEAELFQVLGPGGDLTGRSGLRLVAARWLAPSVLEQVGQTVRSVVKSHHQSAPEEAGLSLETVRQVVGAPNGIIDQVIADLTRRGLVRLRDGRIALSGFSPTIAGGESGLDRLREVLDRAGLEMPTQGELADRLAVANVGPLLRLAVERGIAQPVGREHYAAAGALDRYRDVLIEIGGGGDITPAALRDRLGLSRKYLIPLLEWADRQGITRRVGDIRVLVQNGR